MSYTPSPNPWLGIPLVGALIDKIQNYLASLAATFAPLASPTFTGTPTAPTAAADTSTTQIATTAFVIGQAATTTPLIESGIGSVGTSKHYARADHVHPAASGGGSNSFAMVSSLILG